jgi:MFS family permease
LWILGLWASAFIVSQAIVLLRLREGGALGAGLGAGLLGLIIAACLDQFHSKGAFSWQVAKNVVALVLVMLVIGVVLVPVLRSDPDTFFSSSPDEQFIQTDQFGGHREVKSSRELGRQHWAERVSGSLTFALVLGAFSVINLGRNLLPRTEEFRRNSGEDRP